MMEKLTKLTRLELGNNCSIKPEIQKRFYESIFKQNKITDLKINVVNDLWM